MESVGYEALIKVFVPAVGKVVVVFRSVQVEGSPVHSEMQYGQHMGHNLEIYVFD